MKEEKHNHSHTHDHNHVKKELVLWVIGLLFYLLGTFLIQNTVLMPIIFIVSVVLVGHHIIEEAYVDTFKKKKFTSHLLMVVATLGAFLIGRYSEGTMLMIIFSMAHILEDFAIGKSKKEIESLIKNKPRYANKLFNNEVIKVKVEDLNKGDTIQVLKGEDIPIDSIIIEGTGYVNQSNITGESLPVSKGKGEEVYGSTINEGDKIILEVMEDSDNTLYSKIIKMVENAQNDKSETETFLQKFEQKYVPIVLISVALIILISYLTGFKTLEDSFYWGMMYLVIASPCALVLSISPAVLSSISNGAKKGILFKGGSYIDTLGKLEYIGFDKTGTLTKGENKVIGEDIVINTEKYKDSNMYKKIVYLAESNSTHPLAKAVVDEYKDAEYKENITIDNIEDITGYGMKFTVGKDEYTLGKRNFTDKENFISPQMQIHSEEKLKEGSTVIYLVEKENDRHDFDAVVMTIYIKDVLREDSKDVITYLNKQGIVTEMITGDNENTASEIAKQVGITKYSSNVLPQDKLKIIKDNNKKYQITAMVGDGVNDAPSLANATIGIAMGEGTKVAIEVADMVLMNDDISKIKYAHQLAIKNKIIVLQNIIIAVGVISLMIALNTFGKIDLTTSVMIHEGSTLVVILNGLRMLKSIK